MLRWRLIGAAGFIVPLLLLFFLDEAANFGRPGIWTTPLCCFMATVISLELTELLRDQSSAPVRWISAVIACLLVVACGLPDVLRLDFEVGRWGCIFVALAIGMLLAFVREMLLFDKLEHVVARMSVTIFTAVYAALPFLFLLSLRLEIGGKLGMFGVFSVLAVVKVSDAAAYFVGKSIGRTKMSPRLSPKKTVEGAIGGVVASVVAAWLLLTFAVPFIDSGKSIAALPALIFGGAMAIAGIVGDLAESLLKRDSGRKDSSRWLPGLGGILDVADSVTFASPIAYIWWLTTT